MRLFTFHSSPAFSTTARWRALDTFGRPAGFPSEFPVHARHVLDRHDPDSPSVVLLGLELVLDALDVRGVASCAEVRERCPAGHGGSRDPSGGVVLVRQVRASRGPELLVDDEATVAQTRENHQKE